MQKTIKGLQIEGKDQKETEQRQGQNDKGRKGQKKIKGQKTKQKQKDHLEKEVLNQWR